MASKKSPKNFRTFTQAVSVLLNDHEPEIDRLTSGVLLHAANQVDNALHQVQHTARQIAQAAQAWAHYSSELEKGNFSAAPPDVDLPLVDAFRTTAIIERAKSEVHAFRKVAQVELHSHHLNQLLPTLPKL